VLLKSRHVEGAVAVTNGLQRRPNLAFRNSFKHFVVAVCMLRATCVSAQTNPKLDLRITLGWRTNVADGTCGEGEGHFFRSGQFELGGSARYYVSSRVSIGPELMFIKPCKRQIFTYYHPRLTGRMNAAFDLNRSTRVQPYLVAGFGFVRSKTTVPDPVHYRWEGLGGLGARLFVSDRTFVAPEAHVGGRLETIRFSSSLGRLLE